MLFLESVMIKCCGVDMVIYYDPDQPAIAPNVFLSVGISRLINKNLRLPKLFKIRIKRSINLNLYNIN